MNIVFISNHRYKTPSHYLQQPKKMIEWKLIQILAKNPQLVKILRISFHPMIRKHSDQIIDVDGGN